MKEKNSSYILGLDLGTNSVGWALLDADEKNKPTKIVASGVRIFEAGVEGDIAGGRDASRAAVRREKRLGRRQNWRKAWRMKKVYMTLSNAGLLPKLEENTPQARHEMLLSLDREIFNVRKCEIGKFEPNRLPYFLRAKGLDEALTNYEFGRALFHLAQRRGFLSNRKSKKEENEGVVKKDIRDLEEAINQSGSRTLGEYFFKNDPMESRFRGRWTARSMFLKEFALLWESQKRHIPGLTEKLRREIFHAIFFQRPLKSQKALVGRCTAYPKKRSCAIALPIAQEFRILQAVNNLEAVDTESGASIGLNDGQRRFIHKTLSDGGDLSFSKLRKLLGFPQSFRFNLERGGEKRICGNRTRSVFLNALPERWDNLTSEEQCALTMDILSYQKRGKLIDRLVSHWKIRRAVAEKLADENFEEGYSRFSQQALRELVNKMKDGTPYATAFKALFGEFVKTREDDFLAPVIEVIPDLKNPTVLRALTETRKIVNCLIREYGKPRIIRIELARDLKKSRKERMSISRRNRAREKLREAAVQAILDDFPGYNVRGADIEKYLLAEECNWTCPYTGRKFGCQALLGPQPQFDVEHIIPFSISLDNTFLNKTICYHEENRLVKRNQTPFDAYSYDETKWSSILDRVARFKGEAVDIKREKFITSISDLQNTFVEKHLSDTRYMTKLVSMYLGTLYGGKINADGRACVQATSGSITWILRNGWNLNSILSDGGTKTRDDHRHHAVDAVAIALTDASTVQMISRVAQRVESIDQRVTSLELPPPWKGFLEDVKESIGRIIVSHRVNRKLAGPLHAETIFRSYIIEGEEKYSVRKGLGQLTNADIKNIVDPNVRSLIEDAVKGAAGKKPGDIFKDPSNYPVIIGRNGKPISIKKVRVLQPVKPFGIGSGDVFRFVNSGSNTNHHVEIYLLKSARGEKWEDTTISRMEAYNRMRNNRPIVGDGTLPQRKFLFSLCTNDSIEIRDNNGGFGIYVVRGISSGDIELVFHSDARDSKAIKEAKARMRFSGEKFRKANAIKVNVDPIGNVFSSNE